MLTKQDLNAIEKLIQKNSSNALSEFFEKVLAPYLDEEHKQNQKEHEEIKEKISLIGEHINDHEKRIRKLETATGL